MGGTPWEAALADALGQILERRGSATCTRLVLVRLVVRSSSAMRDSRSLSRWALTRWRRAVERARALGSRGGVGSAPARSGVMTLTRFMIDVSRKDPSLQDLESLMSSIQMGCKTIASLVQRAGITTLGARGGGG